MKTVILAGGFGTRISEESHLKPKPMVEICGMPILWHIMKVFYTQGFDEFVICAGYRQEVIKDWFANYRLHNSNVTFDFSNGGDVRIHSDSSEHWKVSVVDTGYGTMTGGRIKRIMPYVGDEPFFMTYGDGLADIDLHGLCEFHRKRGSIATVTGVCPTQRFGVLEVGRDGMVNEFREKRESDGNVVNGGFMLLEPQVFDYIAGDDTVFENDSLARLAQAGQLNCYRHEGFWQCMDTQREKRLLEGLWSSGRAPWKIW